ncbi:hypothetical protein P7K49_026091 [Saguinus oedipus]|uniref:Uncharacterized protein n=1 Tax=Saguinus oedipus TaxID=9490 RepID=A0ABQ9ULE0_SAGOE|nr:hypothetical protein P7K49_026091 [Saguinus oedipus]
MLRVDNKDKLEETSGLKILQTGVGSVSNGRRPLLCDLRCGLGAAEHPESRGWTCGLIQPGSCFLEDQRAVAGVSCRGWGW